jgi:hypothetical protein
VTEAPAFSVVADVAIVKGATPEADQTWLSFPDGTARRAPVQVIQDLPHLVVESVFGLGDGRWGTLAAARPERSDPVPEPAGSAPRAAISRANGRIRLVTSDGQAAPAPVRPVPPLAKAAVDAVLNRWHDGPDTPGGVRARLRAASGPGHRHPGLAEPADPAVLAAELTDEQIRLAGAGVRRLYRDWAALPVGGTLRATWPLHDSWLRLL